MGRGSQSDQRVRELSAHFAQLPAADALRELARLVAVVMARDGMPDRVVLRSFELAGSLEQLGDSVAPARRRRAA